jgi:glycosyltransferase involved in cell wall biosynthesis
MIKVSIIVPVYNVEQYLEQCLESLVNQTLKDIEIIVVNDGSPDNSQVIIDKYCKKHPKLIKSITKENGGLGSARNRGLEVAEGRYIAFVDSDDWVDLDYYEKMYNLAEKEKSDIVFCNMIDHESEKQITRNCISFDNPFEVSPSACNKLFKRSIIKSNRFFEVNKWYEDLNFTGKLLLKKPKISVIDNCYYHCNSHEGSIMKNNNSIKNLDIIYCIDDLMEYAKDNNIYNKETFSYIIFNHILITSINRVASQKSKDKKMVIKKLLQYCRENIGDYKKYDYYNKVSRNRRIIANLNYRGYYNLSKLLLNVKKCLNK